MVERLHKFARSILRKDRSGFVKAETITEAINAASYDLWNSLVLKLRQGQDSYLLNAFKKETNTISVTDGSATINGGSEYEIMSIEVDPSDSDAEYKDVQLYLAKNDEEFQAARIAQEFEHILKRDAKFYKTTTDTPTSFDASLGVFPDGGTAQAGDWYESSAEGTIDGVTIKANDRIVAVVNNASTSDWSDWDRIDGSLTISNERASVSLPNDLFKTSDVFYFDDGAGNRYEGRIVNDEMFVDREDVIAQGYEHLLKKDFAITVTSLDGTGNDTALKNLPDDMFSFGSVFYNEYNGNRYEGQILDDREFVDRKNSVIIAPTPEKPIARIVGNQIEICPVPTGSDFKIRLPYEILKPDKIPSTLKHSIARLVGNKIEFMAEDMSALTVPPNKFVLPYMIFNPVVRYTISNSDMVLSFNPSSFSDDIKVRYIDTPTDADIAVALTNGEPSYSAPTETGWSDQAFSEIASRMLVYLGVSVDNQLATQIEGLTEQGNVADVKN